MPTAAHCGDCDCDCDCGAISQFSSALSAISHAEKNTEIIGHSQAELVCSLSLLMYYVMD